MNRILETLEWLTRYGMIDIIFGLGILAYIRDRFRTRPVHYIPGIQISPSLYVNEEGGFFDMKIRNTSNHPIYLYQTFLWPGYNVNRIDKSTIGSFLKTVLFLTRVNDKVPRYYDRRNIDGQYPLLANSKEVSEADSIFLQPGQEAEYFLGFEAGDELKRLPLEHWDAVLENHQCGLLRTMFVHGAQTGFLEIQI